MFSAFPLSLLNYPQSFLDFNRCCWEIGSHLQVWARRSAGFVAAAMKSDWIRDTGACILHPVSRIVKSNPWASGQALAHALADKEFALEIKARGYLEGSCSNLVVQIAKWIGAVDIHSRGLCNDDAHT
jgi:hypothetical protein